MKSYLSNLAKLSVILIIMLFSFCKNKKPNDVIEIDKDSINIENKMQQAKEIFYSLPAPHEVATFLIGNDNTFFDREILNKTENSSNYNTETAQAYNLGIYSADLSYASLFDQNQVVINYMATSKKLAEQLGILEAFSQETIKQLEQNVNNRDEIMRIISETFMDSDAFLQENDRQEIGAMILIGGWIEGVYIAVSLTDKKASKNIALTSSILEQQLSLELMVQFLNDFQGTDQLKTIKTDLNELYTLMSSIEPSVTDEGYLSAEQKDFEKICLKIESIRNKIVKLS